MGILLFYDLSEEYDQTVITKWLDDIRVHTIERGLDPTIVLVGAKSDIKLQETEDSLRIDADKNNIPFFVTSAKMNVNIEEVILFMI